MMNQNRKPENQEPSNRWVKLMLVLALVAIVVVIVLSLANSVDAAEIVPVETGTTNSWQSSIPQLPIESEPYPVMSRDFVNYQGPGQYSVVIVANPSSDGSDLYRPFVIAPSDLWEDCGQVSRAQVMVQENSAIISWPSYHPNCM